jgi:hypothetical protein
MSLTMTSCHGYQATGLSNFPAGTTKLWMLAFVKVNSALPGGDYTGRGICQLSTSTLDGTQPSMSLNIDGSNEPKARYRQGPAAEEGTTLFFWNSSNQNRWTVIASILDIDASAADLWAVHGRNVATTVAATESAKTGDLTAPASNLTNLYVGRQQNAVVTGVAADATSGVLIAELAIGRGAIPTLAAIQTMLDGNDSPATLAGVYEHWRLRDSGDGLVGRLQGITLAPFGGAATTVYDADNPTVDDPPATPAPVLTSPSAGTPGTTTITIQATSDSPSDGTMRFLRRVGGAAASDTTIASTGESQAATANPQSRVMTGFTASSTDNFVDMVQVGAGGNSNVVTAGPFTMASLAATAVTITGPSSGTVGSPSTNFTVGANGTITGTVTVTPNDGGDGGTFTPTSVNISSGSPTGTFTYTPANPGSPTATINVTNNGGLTNPSGIAFSASAPSATQLVLSVPDAAGLSGFNGIVLSAAAPGSGVTIIATPTSITFNGSGQATISIVGLSVPIGQRRWVSVSNSTGDPAQSPAPVQAQGPVTAS